MSQSRFVVVLFCLIYLASCTEDNNKKVKLPTPKIESTITQTHQALPEIELNQDQLAIEDVMGVYVGKLPCTDCEAIEYRLELYQDGGYSDHVFHRGKSIEPSQSIGKYTITKNNLINLGKYLPGQNLFAKTKAGLLVLNDDGTRITGANEKRYQLFPEDNSALKNKPLNDRLFAERIMFYASGRKPSWRMNIDNNVGHAVIMPSGEVLEFPLVEAEVLNDYLFRYTSQGIGCELILTFDFSSRCQDDISGDLFDCSVKAEIKRNNGKTEVLQGCGNFTTYPEFFGTSWQLASINKKPANVANYEKGLPTITFGREQRDFYGQDGCNNIAGQFYLLGDKLMFNHFASTAESCPNQMPSRDFNFAIQGNMYSFVLYDGQLTFTNLANTLVFTKKK